MKRRFRKMGVVIAVGLVALTCDPVTSRSAEPLPSLELNSCNRADLPKGARCGVMRVAEDPVRRPGQFDPVTPPKWGEEARKSFPNSLHFITMGAHAAVDSCVATIAAVVFRTGSVQGVDPRCVAEEAVQPFVLQPTAK